MRPHFLYAVMGVCLLALSAQNAFAETGRITNLVSPAKADSLASPLVFRTIQTSTEPDLSGFASPPLGRVGLDTYIRSGHGIYDVPVSLFINPDLQAQFDIPLVSNSESPGLKVGDTMFSIKYRTDVDTNYDAYFIFTAKFPTGEPESHSGTGSYDFSFTHKSIIKCGSYRTTLMAGITIPPPFDFWVMDNGVVYAPTVAYMAATERAFSSTGFSAGIKAAGLHAFSSRINSELQKNALTTIDLIPEVTYRFSERGMAVAGIVVPVFTEYDLPGASNRRDVMINLSVSSFF